MNNTETFHQYYFAQTGTLFGVKPNTSYVLSAEGPFRSFNKTTRILEGANGKYYLPEEHAEKSRVPNLFERTREILSKLSSTSN
jgi:hypothetical protein